MLTLDKVYHAAFKLKEVIRPTDLIHAPQINPDADVYLCLLYTSDAADEL